MRRTTALLLAAVLLAAASPASAAVINFDNLAIGNYGDIPSNYGSLGAGGAGDPNVAVTYSGNNGTLNHLDLWTTGYGDLTNIAFTPSDGTVARINFVANPGYRITSLAFDLGSYQDIARTMRVFSYGLGNTVIVANGTNLPSGNIHSHYSVANSTATSGFIEWGMDWDIGIDNITFEVAKVQRPVPEPTSLALLMGAAGLAAIRRRRQ